MNNREIKFRVWHKISKEWEGYIGLNQIIPHTSLEYTEDDLVFQQYTGLKDKKKNDIYEGDIVEGETEDTFFNHLVVEYKSDYGGYAFVYYLDGLNNNKIKFEYWFKQLKKLKIVGNIFQNPELLK
jgi:uncharacterized phage protein (TIGR01671 family)